MAVSVDMSTPHHFSTNLIWTGEFLRVIENEAKPKFFSLLCKSRREKFSQFLPNGCQLLALCVIQVKNQVLSPLACLVPTAPTAHGGSKGRPADVERHHQTSRGLKMGRVILTGLTKNKHPDLSLDYIAVDGDEKCVVNCKCGWQGKLKMFRHYGGTKELERLWATHSKTRVKKA